MTKNQKSKIRFTEIENDGFCLLQNRKGRIQSATEDGHPDQKSFFQKNRDLSSVLETFFSIVIFENYHLAPHVEWELYRVISWICSQDFSS